MNHAEFIERHLLAQLSEALESEDEHAIAVARYELREFYKSLGMHP
jgi:hypothetical protein